MARRRSTFIADLRTVLAERGFRRLFATRLVSQTGDGIVTAGVGTYVFFNASSFPSPAAGAAAFTVLYLPYSLVGPFAGVFIDRWSRRQILVWSAVLRSAFVTLTAVLMALGNRGVPLYVAVLFVLGVNRFFLSSLSAALPHVVAKDQLVMANSVSPTVGGIMASVGGGIALGLNVATGNTERGAAITLLAGGGCYVAASLIAATMRRDLLGPVREPGQPPGRLLGELASVALMSILLYRNYFYSSRVTVAEGHLGGLLIASAVGYACAALITPPMTRRLSKPAWITLLLAASAVVTATLGETFIQVAYLAVGFCLYLCRQGVAICATTILQEEVDDAYRGRVFAFYDMMLNVTFVAGAALSAAFLPGNGHSPVVIGLVAAGYAILAAAYWLSRPAGQSSSGSSGDGMIPAASAQPNSS